MRISLEGLQVIDAIHRRGSFAGAAEELFRVPSTITYAVQKLEEDLVSRRPHALFPAPVYDK